MSATYRITYSREAAEDLRSLGTYVARTLRAPKSARRQSKTIRKTIGCLKTMPKRHPLVDSEHLAAMGLRWMCVGKHVVYYLVDDEALEVFVARIAYGGRDPDSVLGDLN